MENWKAAAFLLAAGQGLLLSLALVVRGLKQQRASLFLGLMLFGLALELLNAWGMQVHYHSAPGAFRFWNFQSYLQLPVSLWFFVQLTTRPDYVLKKQHWLFYLPTFLEVLIRWSWQFYRGYWNSDAPSLLANPVWFFGTELLPIFGMFVVLGLYARPLRQVQAAWKKGGLTPGFGHYLRLYGLFGFLWVLTLLWLFGVVFGWPIFKAVEWLLTACLFGLGYIGYVEPSFFTLPGLPTPKPADKPDFAQYDDGAELQRLRSAFRQEALHRQSRLTIEDVAASLQLPPRYVSYLINTHCATNFNTFVNRFRVEDVIQKLSDPRQQHKTILALALEAGFNSKSTFNQVFKQHTGKSPSHYLPVHK